MAGPRKTETPQEYSDKPAFQRRIGGSYSKFSLPGLIKLVELKSEFNNRQTAWDFEPIHDNQHGRFDYGEAAHYGTASFSQSAKIR